MEYLGYACSLLSWLLTDGAEPIQSLEPQASSGSPSGAGSPGFEPSSLAFLGHKQGAKLEPELSGKGLAS